MRPVTIHPGHPFLDPEGERRPVRRLRARLPAPVTVWGSAGPDPGVEARAGLTVSSLLVADGEPARVLGLVDEESELWTVLRRSGACAVSLLGTADRQVADAFAGLTPSPGGVFRTGTWVDTAWGPVLAERSFVGGRLVSTEPREVGWSLLVELGVEQVELAEGGLDTGALVHHRGRYMAPDG